MTDFEVQEWTRELCKALGLDPKVTRSITIRCAAGGVPVATAEVYLTGNRGVVGVIERVAWVDPPKEALG